MRKCCCCISVHIGAAILGFIGALICALELVVLLPYLLEVDEDVFNPIKENLDQVFYILEKMLEENQFPEQDIDDITDNIKQYLWPTLLGSAIESAIYGLCCVFMIIGSQCKVRGLMIPYLVLQMLAIIILLLVGVAITVGLFFLNVIMGVIAGVVVLVLGFLLIYFWVAVQRAYVELGNRDYMYSPPPIKQPVYKGPVHANDGRGGYYPATPQHFQMEEHHK